MLCRAAEAHHLVKWTLSIQVGWSSLGPKLFTEDDILKYMAPSVTLYNKVVILYWGWIGPGRGGGGGG